MNVQIPRMQSHNRAAMRKAPGIFSIRSGMRSRLCGPNDGAGRCGEGRGLDHRPTIPTCCTCRIGCGGTPRLRSGSCDPDIPRPVSSNAQSCLPICPYGVVGQSAVVKALAVGSRAAAQLPRTGSHHGPQRSFRRSRLFPPPGAARPRSQIRTLCPDPDTVRSPPRHRRRCTRRPERGRRLRHAHFRDHLRHRRCSRRWSSTYFCTAQRQTKW